MSRVYLDWNATAPLRPEARAAMIAAMDVVGNPSSVHAEGRAAKALVEKARGQVAELVGCDGSEVVFTSGATEAANTFSANAQLDVVGSTIEHDALVETFVPRLAADCNGHVSVNDPPSAALQLANSETGVLQKLPADLFFVDAVQALGKVNIDFASLRAFYLAASAHKFGGPKGVGCLVERARDAGEAGFGKAEADIIPLLSGGGQEMGRRSGTENVIGIVGFGAAAKAAEKDLRDGVWEHVAELRNILESALEAATEELIIFGKDVARLPNTSCFAVPGWKGETQVMQMDLAGYAVSAGSACSSGKVKESRVLRAMGFDSLTASSAIRVSLGPTTTEAEVLGFVDAWTGAYRRWKTRAA